MNAQQLKNSILQEAIEGRLVPQDPNDEPASILLEKIRKEKAKLVKEKKIKADKNESHIYRTEDGHWMEHFEDKKREDVCIDGEIPFNIPQGWEWVRWGMLGDYKKGPFGSSLTKSMFVPKSDEAVKVYEQKNAIQKDYSLGDYYISKQKYEAMKGFTVYPGDIIVSCAGTIGETYLLPKDAPEGIINQALMRARLHFDSIVPYWLLYFRYILLIANKLKGAGFFCPIHIIKSDGEDPEEHMKAILNRGGNLQWITSDKFNNNKIKIC
jgi:type I restriction enzyme S subunit